MVYGHNSNTPLFFCFLYSQYNSANDNRQKVGEKKRSWEKKMGEKKRSGVIYAASNEDKDIKEE